MKEAPTKTSELRAKVRYQQQEKEQAQFRRKKYSTIVRNDFLPTASEQKREELVNANLSPTTLFARQGSHVSPEYFSTKAPLNAI